MRNIGISLNPGTGRMEIDVPGGVSVHGLESSSADELSRLGHFHRELAQILRWIELADRDGQDSDIRDALSIAALIKFCGCFKSTEGLRAKPLKTKRIYQPADRRLVERLTKIRNRVVAHDDQLFPGNTPLVVLDKDAKAILAISLMMGFSFSAMAEYADLGRLTSEALVWVAAEYERIAEEIVADVNGLSQEQRENVQKQDQDFKLTVTAEDKL